MWAKASSWILEEKNEVIDFAYTNRVRGKCQKQCMMW